MRGSGDQKLSSFNRRSLRSKLSPQVCGFWSVNFSVRNGIRISAYQPVSTMRVRASQMPSQLALISRPSFDICASHLAPAGLMANS